MSPYILLYPFISIHQPSIHQPSIQRATAAAMATEEFSSLARPQSIAPRDKTSREGIRLNKFAKPLGCFNKDERVQWVKDNKHVCGSDLAKKVCEAHIRQSIKTQSMKFSAAGDLMDWDDAERQYREKPDDWDHIRSNCHTFKNPYTGKLLIWIPTFHMAISREEQEVDERKRKMEADFKIKPDKSDAAGAAGANKKAKFADAAGAEGEEPDVEHVDVTAAQKKRIENSIPKLEEVQLKILTKITDAQSPDMAQAVAPMLLTKAKAAEAELSGGIAALKAVFASGKAPKGALNHRLREVSDAKNSSISLRTALENAMELATNGF